jgi:hypothetical protein
VYFVRGRASRDKNGQPTDIKRQWIARCGSHYVASLSAELSTLARRSGLETLVYLLEMVRLEAENTKSEIGAKAR